MRREINRELFRQIWEKYVQGISDRNLEQLLIDYQKSIRQLVGVTHINDIITCRKVLVHNTFGNGKSPREEKYGIVFKDIESISSIAGVSYHKDIGLVSYNNFVFIEQYENYET